MPKQVEAANNPSVDLPQLSPDKPLEDPAEDRLGYASFAMQLATAINETPAHSLVVGLYGDWGAGKTTTINFVTRELENFPEAGRPNVIRFNPWWFSGQEDLTRSFFKQLLAAVEGQGLLSDTTLELLGDFARLVSRLPEPTAITVGSLLKLFLNAKRVQASDVVQLKNKLDRALGDQPRRFLVVMDDIDRLTAEEIRQMFRLVKSVADFPRVSYLLAFDKKVVVKALEGLQTVSGEEYLEKIVQVAFELPLPDRAALRRLLFNGLDSMTTGSPSELVDPTYFGNLYYGALEHFFLTPRDVNRFLNTLIVTFPAVSGEVNPVDFIAVECLRLFSPEAYDALRRNKESFAGLDTAGTASKEEAVAFHNAWLAQVPEADRQIVKEVSLRLFPRLNNVWGNMAYSSDFLNTWRKQLRICSPDIFDVYFRLSVPTAGVSRAEIEALLAVAGDRAKFAHKLLASSQTPASGQSNKARALLDRLEDHTGSDIPEDQIETVVSALFDVGDELAYQDERPTGFGQMDLPLSIGRVIYQLTRRLEEDDRFRVYKQAVESSPSILLASHEIALLTRQSERGHSSDLVVTDQHLDELQATTLRKIESAAANGQLLTDRWLPYILYRWRDWGSLDDVRTWLRKKAATDEGLASVIYCFSQLSSTLSVGDKVQKFKLRVHFEGLDELLAVEDLAPRAGQITQNEGLKADHLDAVRTFSKGYEDWRRGQNPDVL